MPVNPKQAFWQASVTVGLPTLVLGSVFLYWARPSGTAEWSGYVMILFAVFAVLSSMLYRKYRRGPQPIAAKSQIVAAILYAIAGAGYTVDAFLTRVDQGHAVARFFVAFCWLGVAAIQLLHVRKQWLQVKSASERTD